MPQIQDSTELNNLFVPSHIHSDSTTSTLVGQELTQNRELQVDARLKSPVDTFRDDALSTFQSHFGNEDPLKVARIMMESRNTELTQCCGLSYRCCFHHDGSGIASIGWLCFSLIYPEIAFSMDVLAEKKSKIERLLFGRSYKKPAWQRLTTQISSWNSQADKLAMSTLHPRWEEFKMEIRLHLEEVEEAWVRLKSMLLVENIDVVFEQFLSNVIKAIEHMETRLKQTLVEIDWREEAMEEAIFVGIGMDPPHIDGENIIDERYRPPNPFYERYRDLESSLSITQLQQFRERLSWKWRIFQGFLGREKTVKVLMSIFCTIGLVASLVAIYQCTSAGRRPSIDSNFWSSFSQTNIGIAAIYSIIIPQLQGGSNPVPRNWQGYFKSLLLISVATALMATIVYPWHGRTSIFAAFISTLTQLAVTLLMILGSRRQINNLEMEVTALKSDRRRRW